MTDHDREARWRLAVDHDDMFHRVRGAIHEANLEQEMLYRDLSDMTADRDSWEQQASDVLAHWDAMREDRNELKQRLKDAGIGVKELDSTETRWAALKAAIGIARKSHDLDMLSRCIQREFDRAEMLAAMLVHARAENAALRAERGMRG